MARQRERIRRKALVADSSSAVDLSNVKPAFTLGYRGKRLWQHFTDDTPFWWNAADIPMAGLLCATTDAVASALKDGTPAQQAQMLREWRSLAGELGMSPTSRGRLRLTEAQSTIAARRVESMDNKRRPVADVIDIEDLLADG